MSRIMAGKLRLELAPVDLAELLHDSLESAKPSADAKGIRLLESLDGEATIMADAHRLQQVMSNLLSNAVKFTHEGGNVRLHLECDAAVAEISVVDTGRGINETFLPHVFERFRQEGTPAGRLSTGLGLGLAITHQLVALHGGEITVASEGEGKGAQFTVRLPLALSRRDPAPSARARVDGCDVAGMRVVIVEDDDDSREMLRMALESAGVQVRQAATIDDCMHLLHEAMPDAIVTDLGLSDRDGYALLELARALASDTKLPVIALTAFAQDTERSRALAAGFDAFLTKPLDDRALTAALSRVRARS